MKHSNLIELLQSLKSTESKGITFIEGGDREVFLSYAQLYTEALGALSLLRKCNICAGDELVLQIDDQHSFIVIFWASILGGIIAVPVSTGSKEDHEKLFFIWDKLRNPFLISTQKYLQKLKKSSLNLNWLDVFHQMESSHIEVMDLMSNNHCDIENDRLYEASGGDIAFVQFSSGSTGDAKGVVLTHKNLLTNMHDIAMAANYSDDDSMLSWMPLTHDMGMIGFHINPLYCHMNQYLIPTNLFVRRPGLWLQKATEHKVSILCSPNFGYRYFLKHCNLESQSWDLSSVRLIYNGAEPISKSLCDRFIQALVPYKLHPRAMCPVYGLAEASLAVSITNLDEDVKVLALERDYLGFGDRISVSNGGESTIAVVNVGYPIFHCEVKITDENNCQVTEQIIGQIQIRGNNVTSCYYDNEQASENVIDKEGWLNTGDLGFMSERALYITGRQKDVIFINGQNYYAHDIERIAQEVNGIELNKVVIAAHFNGETQREEVIGFIFHRGALDRFIPLIREVRAIINDKIGVEIDCILPVKNIPRTTSGKLQRFKLLSLYLSGALNETRKEVENLLEVYPLDLAKPENVEEEKLLHIWQKVLLQRKIGVNQNFFSIGGNSLKVAEVEMLVNKVFQVELPISSIYKLKTIRTIAKEIKFLDKKVYASIQKVEAEEFPLSYAQRRIYYAWRKDPSSTAYNLPTAFEIVGNIDEKKLEACISTLASTYDMLRAEFILDEEPLFRVTEATNYSLSVHSCTDKEADEVLKQWVRPFDLEAGHPFRVALLKTESKTILFTDFHHIVADGFSVSRWMESLINFYEGEELEVFTQRYGDFVMWQRNSLPNSKKEKLKRYWQDHLQDIPLLYLPTDFSRPPVLDTTGKKLSFELNNDQSQGLKLLAKTNGCTLHTLLFTLYRFLIGKFTGQEEIVIGIPVSARRHPDLHDMFGMFVNNLPIKTKIDSESSFTDVLKQVDDCLAEAYQHQDYPFDLLVEQLTERRDASRSPVFDTMFMFTSVNKGFKNSDFEAKRYFFDPGISKFDLSMEVFEEEEVIRYAFEFSTALFKPATISRLAAFYEKIINEIIESPEQAYSNINLLTQSEYEKCVTTFNSTRATYGQEKNFLELFDIQVNTAPDEIAIRYKEEQLTFYQLNDKANRIAAWLQGKGVKKGNVIGLFMDNSPDFVIAVMGVIKTGAAYLPVDTSTPLERVRYLIRDSRCVLLLVNEEYESFTSKIEIASETQVLCWSEIDWNIFKDSILSLDSEDLAYVIYTSGTTGKPKGVMVSHGALVNYINWGVAKYVGKAKKNFPLFTSVAFDLTITSIFIPLASGGKIIVYKDEGSQSAFESMIKDKAVDTVKLTPSHLKIINQSARLSAYDFSHIECFIVGGEALSTKVALDTYRLCNGQVVIYNEYGPTEATIGCMIYEFDPATNSTTVPIGRPVSNMQVYLLDHQLRPLPTGIVGDIYVSGKGLAKGYLHNPSLTEEKFLSHPFISGERIYKTGDRAKRLSDNTLEFKGRIDEQVKMNGYRIEPEEIVYCLMQHKIIDNAAVTTRKTHNGNDIICAYYTSTTEMANHEASVLLRDYLVDYLPHYMVPVHFTKVTDIPLTVNGKVNPEALPDPVMESGKENTLPRNATQQKVMDAWQQVFGQQTFGIHDNFFALGGDSIKAVQIVGRLQEENLNVSVKDILTRSTIAGISIVAQTIEENISYPQGIVTGEKPYSPIEHWFFNQQFKKPQYYNQSVTLKIKRPLNTEYLTKAFEEVLVHHDGLRVNYDVGNKKTFYNKQHLKQKFALAFIAIDQETDEFGSSFSQQLLKKIHDFKSEMNLERGLLIKSALLRQRNSDCFLIITVHHLLVDGFSWRVLLEDLLTSYVALSENKNVILPKKTASLIDWNNALDRYIRKSFTQKEINYWNEIGQTQFHLPLDEDVKVWRESDGATIYEVLDKVNTEFLLKSSRYKVDTEVILLAALLLAFKEWMGTEKVLLEIENHGRHLDDINVSRTMGWFTCLYPLSFDVSERDLGGFIKLVKEKIKQVPSKGIGYGVLKYIKKEIDETNHGLPELRFNYLGQFADEFENDHFSYLPLHSGFDTAKENEMTAKMEFNLMVISGELHLALKYNQKAFKSSTATSIQKRYKHYIMTLIEYLKKESNVYFTPSDFNTLEIDQNELDALFD